MREIAILNTEGKDHLNKYLCVFDWKSNIELSCGVEAQKSNTAFFEAFFEGNLIREESDTISDAEKKVWKRYFNIINCHEHDFHQDITRRGKCGKCGFFIENMFSPKSMCVICQKKSVLMAIENKNYCCIQHFIEEYQMRNKKPNDEDIKDLKNKVFLEIKKGNKEQDPLFNLISNKKEIKTIDDIGLDHWMMEIELNEWDLNYYNMKLYSGILKLGINKFFKEEYLLNDFVEKSRVENSNKSYRMAIEFVEDICSKLENKIKFLTLFKFVDQLDDEINEIQNIFKTKALMESFEKELNMNVSELFFEVFDKKEYDYWNEIEKNITKKFENYINNK